MDSDINYIKITNILLVNLRMEKEMEQDIKNHQYISILDNM